MDELSYIPWDKLRHKTLFITGATGLIGAALIGMLLQENKERELDLHVIALVRNEQEARLRIRQSKCVSFACGSVEELPAISQPIDFIVHAASMTSSKAFVMHPVEVIETSVYGTSNVLKLACDKAVEGFAYLSSMEVYGNPAKGHKVTEDEIGCFDVTDARSCYPVSKILCENLCFSYAHEYGVPANVLRLTQTFGPGAQYDDGRVFAEFARCAVEKKNIVLKTDGKTERSYLYTEDAAAAILTVLLHGVEGELFNVANEATYCSIASMAELVAKMYGIQVEYELQDVANLGFAGTLYMDLDTSKLRSLGWRPSMDLANSFRNLVDYFSFLTKDNA